MRIALMTLASAASLCALATTASAQDYSFGGEPGTPPYAYHHTGPQPGAVGSCQIIAGNRVCDASPAGFGYDQGPWGPVGAVIGAPYAIIAAPFGVMGAAGPGATEGPGTGAPPYSYESQLPPQPGATGYCDIISGNRVCFP
jgi:hypothetical protein